MSDQTPDNRLLQVDLMDENTVHMGMDRSTGEPVHTESRGPDANADESVQLRGRIEAEAQSAGGTVERESITRHEGGPGGGSARRNYFDGGFDTTMIEHCALMFGSGGAGIVFLKTAGPALVQWLKNRGSRSVRIKYGDAEVSLTGTNDISTAIEAIEKLAAAPSGGDPAPSTPPG
jgi:hypothetical protein